MSVFAPIAIGGCTVVASRDRALAVQRRWYAAHRDSHQLRVRSRRAALKMRLKEYKRSCKCCCCGESDPVCLDFHHVGVKRGDIRTLVKNGCSWETVIAEIDECVVVCANCHLKIEHYKRIGLGLGGFEPPFHALSPFVWVPKRG